MSFNLGTDSKNETSYAIFGEVDSTAYTDPLVPFNIQNDDQWAIEFKGLQYNGVTLDSESIFSDVNAIVDTGTSLIAIPTGMYNNLTT